MAILMTEKTEAYVSPEGELGYPIPERLEVARLVYQIPDVCFSNAEAVFRRILIYQISMHKSETYGDTQIIRPEVTQTRDTQSSPMGVIVSAGLAARDYLVANGMDIGSLVSVVRLGPYAIPVGIVGTKEITLRLMDVGDIVASHELPGFRKDGIVNTVLSEVNNEPHHTLEWSADSGIDTKTYKAIAPETGDDY